MFEAFTCFEKMPTPVASHLAFQRHAHVKICRFTCSALSTSPDPVLILPVAAAACVKRSCNDGDVMNGPYAISQAHAFPLEYMQVDEGLNS